MTAITSKIRLRRKAKPAPIAINNGRPIRLRAIQMPFWGLVVAACGAALVAGIYFNVLQVNWHVGPTQLFYLKDWWDGGMGFIKSPDWYLYRHGVRDLGEPALAVIAVKTLLAPRKTWDKRIGPVNIIIRVLLLVAATVGLALGGIWVLDFGIPKLVALPSWVTTLSLGQLILGFVIGQVVHRIWAPAGATLQGHYIDRAVDRSKITGRIPLWIRYPLSPVQVRERFVWLREHDTVITERKNWLKWVLPLLTIVLAYLVITGFIAHYWIGAGHSFPYLAP